MPKFYGVRDLRCSEDWKAVVGPKNWVCGTSAYELAQKWQGCRNLPEKVKAVFLSAGKPFDSLRATDGWVEMPTFLDSMCGPSRTDIMLYCFAKDMPEAIIGVEGKARERFDKPVNRWIRNKAHKLIDSRVKRLEFLSHMLGPAVKRIDRIDPDSTLRYQLIHRTASVVSECMLHGAQLGMLLVHSFYGAQPDQNWEDFLTWTKHVGVNGVAAKNAICGPAHLGPKKEVKVYFAWVADVPHAQLV